MITRLLMSATCSLMLACAGAQAREAPAATRAEIVALTQALMDAIVPGDAAVWQRVLADDAVIIDEFGRRQTKADAVKAIHAFPPGISGSIEIRNAHVHAYGDTAIIDCEQYERETYFGQAFVVRYVATATYVRRGGAWKLAAFEDVTLPTPPPKIAVAGLAPADYRGTYRIAPERAWTIADRDGQVTLRTRAGAPEQVLEPVARDVFMGGDDERNLLLFRRGEDGAVVELIERRKFNDLHLQRER